MKQKKRITALMAGLILVGTSVFGGVSAASAATVYVEGGKWHYGSYEPSSTIFVFSDFDHARKKHRSTACSNYGCRYDTRGPGIRSHAQIQATGSLFRVSNTAFYYVF